VSGYKIGVGGTVVRVKTFQEVGPAVMEAQTGLLAQGPEGPQRAPRWPTARFPWARAGTPSTLMAAGARAWPSMVNRSRQRSQSVCGEGRRPIPPSTTPPLVLLPGLPAARAGCGRSGCPGRRADAMAWPTCRRLAEPGGGAQDARGDGGVLVRADVPVRAGTCGRSSRQRGQPGTLNRGFPAGLPAGAVTRRAPGRSRPPRPGAEPGHARTGDHRR
jgi:hypothetical protein